MTNEFLFQSWLMLRESISFPNEQQLIAMKKVMDGEKSVNKNDLKNGMKLIGAKNLYELVLWGLRSDIIQDKPIDIGKDIISKGAAYYPVWLKLLNYTVSGYSDSEIETEGRISKNSIKYYRDLIAKKFNLGDSPAKLIRFAFQVLNPISGPGKLATPHKAAISPHTTLKNPPMISKFRPATIDPNYEPDYRSSKGNRGSIAIALQTLGIDPSVIRGKTIWDRPPEKIWSLLELAKRRYELEISHAHPDRPGGNTTRARQMNAAWKFVKEKFAQNGYELGQH